jgi:hypothetical protein
MTIDRAALLAQLDALSARYEQIRVSCWGTDDWPLRLLCPGCCGLIEPCPDPAYIGMGHHHRHNPACPFDHPSGNGEVPLVECVEQRLLAAEFEEYRHIDAERLRLQAALRNTPPETQKDDLS